jgi:hypothetical protein
MAQTHRPGSASSARVAGTSTRPQKVIRTKNFRLSGMINAMP